MYGAASKRLRRALAGTPRSSLPACPSQAASLSSSCPESRHPSATALSVSRGARRATAGRTPDMRPKRKRPASQRLAGLENRRLAVTYFHMGKPHTIIGAERFHYRVRDGVGWFPLAMAARQLERTQVRTGVLIREVVLASSAPSAPQAMLGRYMVKPHGQLVLVSFTHCCASTPSLSTS